MGSVRQKRVFTTWDFIGWGRSIMSRKSRIYIVALCIALVYTLAACGTPTTTDGKPLYPNNMNAKRALQLREDYVRFLEETSPNDHGWDLDKTRVSSYFGHYNGCDMVYMDCDQAYTQALRSVEVAGYVITFGSGQEVYAYKDAQFYTLQSAYEAGLLTEQDVYAIGLKIDSAFRDKNQRNSD